MWHFVGAIITGYIVGSIINSQSEKNRFAFSKGGFRAAFRDKKKDFKIQKSAIRVY